MDCRECTRLIVQKDSEYLVGCVFGTRILKWSNSPYDAWRTRIKERAIRVAHGVEGEIILFNPVVGQIRKYMGGQF